ncbi:PaaI family thioesterase [Acidianus sp. HS-5]|uniref:PaaI family thioesterase n=1 Tax=Acidianus sp. HS-5 TaxID=2886040 RepID=UPI001F46E82B|nr:PaaI family thioesterase [Acidianus sp. HS-5]BDC18570.1 esterase [Acidianus sp. HS-5]
MDFKVIEKESVASYLGMRVIEVKDGISKLEIPYSERICRRGGVLHGGMIMTSMDYAGGLAVASINDGIDQVTQELKVNFLEPMYDGPFTVEAKIVRKGRTAVVVEIEFRDSEGKLGAVGLGTWYIIRDRKVTKDP